jgi:hypothetical protein
MKVLRRPRLIRQPHSPKADLPAPVRWFGSENLLSLKRRTRRGAKPCALQMRCTSARPALLGHRGGDALPAEKFRQVLARIEHPGLYSVHWNSNDPRDIFD